MGVVMTTTDKGAPIPAHIVGMRVGGGQVTHLFDLSRKYRIESPHGGPLVLCSAARTESCVLATIGHSPRICKRCLEHIERHPWTLESDSAPCRDDAEFRTATEVSGVEAATIAQLSATVAALTERVERYLEELRDRDGDDE